MAGAAAVAIGERRGGEMTCIPTAVLFILFYIYKHIYFHTRALSVQRKASVRSQRPGAVFLRFLRR